MMPQDAQDILDRAKQLLRQGARVDQSRVGSIYLGETQIAVRHEIWLALRAMAGVKVVDTSGACSRASHHS